ncbi:MAG: ABC transporter permease [Dysgonamonadaceae bacterium]|jgi:ABC-2 type transport system permease protein|nr:ABC transporter permease [Dysgonamonadaceae bacterium]
MSKIGIVIQREYSTRVRKKSFIILTILTPILLIGISVGTGLLATLSNGDVKNIVVADDSNEYFPVFQDTEQYHFIKAKEGFEDFRKNSDEDIYATLVITGNLLENPKGIVLYSQKQVVSSLVSVITSQLNNYLSEKKLASYDIPNLKEILEESKVSVDMQTIRWDEAGNEKETSAELAMAIGMIFSFLIYMFILAYGSMVMQGVMEEKTNRIVEVMVSSVKPFDLLMGKLIAIGLVGLTQFGLWALLCAGFGMSSSFFLSNFEMFNEINGRLGAVNLFELSAYFILFFIGGYLIYASLFAAIGAMVNSPEDTQQYMMPITVLIIFAFVAGSTSSQNPDGPLAFWTSMFPFTSPFVMMARLPYGISWQEMILSVILLIITVILIVKLAAKIYRTGILMYGKKPTYAEIIKWLRY